MDTNGLIKFLVEAKKNTYANASAEKISSSREGSSDYEYSVNYNGVEYKYHDTYFGGTKFMGEEVVYSNSQIFWGMNYYGVTLDESLSEEAMDKALRPALMEVGKEGTLPLRGPKEFVNGEYRYTFSLDGTIENFIGEEKIFKNDQLIYQLHCHGGLIK